MTLLDEFIEYLHHEVDVHSIYVIGAQGQRGAQITEKWIRSRETETSYADRAVAHWKKECAAGYGNVLGAFDCSGLGMYFIQNLKGMSKGDLNANGMYSKCSKKLKKDELKRGDWVFILKDKRAVHIGYIVDEDLNVIESRGRDYGVIMGALDDRWTNFGRPDFFKDDIEREVAPMDLNIVIRRNLKKGLDGEDVFALQTYLNRQGYSLTCDGKFGSGTQEAVKGYQKSVKLTADGVAGEKTIKSLGLVWGKGMTDNEVIIGLQDIRLSQDVEIESLNKTIETKNNMLAKLNEELVKASTTILTLNQQIESINKQVDILETMNDSMKMDILSINEIIRKYVQEK